MAFGVCASGVSTTDKCLSMTKTMIDVAIEEAKVDGEPTGQWTVQWLAPFLSLSVIARVAIG